MFTKVKEVPLPIDVVLTETIFPLNWETKVSIFFQIPWILKTQIERSNKVYHIEERLKSNEYEVDSIRDFHIEVFGYRLYSKSHLDLMCQN